MKMDWENWCQRPPCKCTPDLDKSALAIAKHAMDVVVGLGDVYQCCGSSSGFVFVTAIATLLRGFAMQELVGEFAGRETLTHDERVEVIRRSTANFQMLVKNLSRDVTHRDSEITTMIEREGATLS